MFSDLIPQWIAEIKEASGGRLDITPHAAGSLVPNDEIMDAVRTQVVEMGSSNPAYWSGSIPVAEFNSPPPFSVRNQWEMHAAFYNAGLLDIHRRAYAEHNVYYLSPVACPGFRLASIEPVESLDDMRAMKIRTIGLTAKVFEKVGVPTTYIPGQEIYTGLATGLIDAATWGGAYSQYQLKFYEVAKYFLSNWLSPGSGECVIINMDVWNSLPDDLKELLEAFGEVKSCRKMMYYYNGEISSLADMVQNQGVTVTTLPDADIETLTQASQELLDEIAKEDPYNAEAVECFKNFMKELGYL